MKTKAVNAELMPDTEKPAKQHHATKSKKAVALRRNRLIKAVIDGEPLKKVAISMGISPHSASSTASQIINSPKGQSAYVRILEQRGLTDDYISQKAYDLLNADSTLYFAKDGIVTDSRKLPAWETQRKTLELVNRLKGHLKDNATTQDPSIMLMQVVVTQINTPKD